MKVLNTKLGNFVWFQSIWFLAVFTQYQFFLVICALVAAHFLFIRHRKKEAFCVLPVAFFGCFVDICLTFAGFFQFSEHILFINIPYWLVALWIGFAATLGHSLSYLQNRFPLAVILGAISAPMSYWAGNRFGAVEFPLGLLFTMVVLACVWAVLLPLALKWVVAIEQKFTPSHSFGDSEPLVQTNTD